MVAGLRQRRAEQARIKYCETMIQRLWKHPSAWPFWVPVDAKTMKLVDYHDIIKKPMDMGTIKLKLQRLEYMTADDVLADFDLMFNNCRLYNKPDQDIVKMCNDLEKVRSGKRLGLWGWAVWCCCVSTFTHNESRGWGEGG